MQADSKKLLFLLFVVVVDCLIIFDAFAVAYLLRFQLQWGSFHWEEPPEQYLKAMIVVAYFWILLFKANGLYDFSKTKSSIDTVHSVAKTITFGTVIILSISYFYREFSFSRLVCVYAWGLSILLFSFFRLALGRLRAEIFREGVGVRKVLLVGSRKLAQFLVRRINGRPELGYRVVGALDDQVPSRQLGCRVLGQVGELERVVDEQQIDRVFIAHGALGHLQQLEIIATCDRLSVPLSIVPPTYDLLINYQDFEEIDGIPIVSVRERESRWLYEACKRCFDVLASSIALIVMAPIGLLIAAAIWLDSDGSAFFSQTRVGQNGRKFRMWKFRTMVVNAEAMLPGLVDIDSLDQAVFKLDNDPRVTRVGRFLRRTSLDEFPQLLNVLAGDMSLVGPRPEESAIVERYGIAERRRLKLKPGLTGLQQIECRGTKDLRERIRWDVLYLRKRSFFLDLWVLLKTVWVVASGRGAS